MPRTNGGEKYKGQERQKLRLAGKVISEGSNWEGVKLAWFCYEIFGERSNMCKVS